MGNEKEFFILLFLPLCIAFYYQSRIMANLFPNIKLLRGLTLMYDSIHYYVLLLKERPRYRRGDIALYDPKYGAYVLEITDVFVDRGYLKYEWRSLSDLNWEYKYHLTSAIDMLSSPISRQSNWFLLYASPEFSGTKNAGVGNKNGHPL